MKSSEKKKRKKARKDLRRLLAEEEEEVAEDFENLDELEEGALAALVENLTLKEEELLEEDNLEDKSERRWRLVVAESAAATKRERVERNRVLVHSTTLNAVPLGTYAMVEGENGQSCLATVWMLDSVKEQEIQLSKTMLDQFPAGSTVSLQLVNAISEVFPCIGVRLWIEGFDIWSRKSISQCIREKYVMSYIHGILSAQEYLAAGTKLGILLNGYYCLLHIKEITVEGNLSAEAPLSLGFPTPQMTIEIDTAADDKTKDNGNHTIPKKGTGIGSLVGGLKHQVEQATEVITTALASSPDFSGKVARGVLLHGPPGTGKTLIARSAAQAFNASIFTINGAEVMSEFVGQAEDRIRKVFRQARENQPSVIFMDELDALCPSRTASENDHTHVRIVALLLQEMDKLHEYEVDPVSNVQRPQRVAVLAATNRVHTIDLALRRPGRFDREVEIPVPNDTDRVDILRIHLQGIPHKLTYEEEDRLGKDLHGFVGADILSLCREAGWRALRRGLSSGISATDTAGQESICTEWQDFVAARGVIRPSALRELAVEVPSVKWDDVGGQEEVKQQLKEAVEWPLQHPEAFQRMGIRPPQGVLLYGPPGCSKTLLAKAIATEGKMNFIAIKGPELFSKWVGESERAVHELFKKARMTEPTVIFFDEIDALASARGSGAGEGGGGVADRVLSQLLLEMDGLEDRKRVIVVAATNRPDILDPALVRPGRLDRMIFVPPPGQEARLEILKIHTRGMPLGSKVSLETLSASFTEGFSGAEVAALCREAAMKALQENMDSETVEQSHFEAAAKETKKQITEAMLAFYHGIQTARG